MLRRDFLSFLPGIFLPLSCRADQNGWNPLADPRGQPGLLWHNDWAKEYGVADVNRGSWVRALGNRGETFGPFHLQYGKYTQELAWNEGATGDNQAIMYPSNGILPANNFWFGMWMHLKTDMAEWTQPGIVWLGNQFQNLAVLWNTDDKTIAINCVTCQGGVQRGGGPKFTLPIPVPKAGDRVHLGLRVVSGRISLYLNGHRCTPNSEMYARIPTPLPVSGDGVMDSTLGLDGIIPMYSVGRNRAQTGFACSDLCLFAGNPDPGGRSPQPPENTLMVTPAPLPPSLTYFPRLTRRMIGGCQTNNRTPGAAPLLKGVLGSMRMAALMLASPMEAEEGATTPTKGLSPGSRWNWDTQVIQRTLDWAYSCADELMIDLGGVPQALQDPHYPITKYFTGAAVRQWVACDISWRESLPNWQASNTTDETGKVVLSDETADAYAEAAIDLYLFIREHCQHKGYDFSKIRWCFWNEPDGAGFWPGIKTFADPKRELWKLLRSLMRHGRAADKNFAVDAPGLAGTNPFGAWLPSLFHDAMENGYADGLRAIHYHAYDSLSMETLEYAVREVERLRLAAGMPRPLPVVLGEYAWTASRMLGSTPDWPAGDPKYAWGCGSWQAAQIARMTINAAYLQRIGGGVESLHLFSPIEYAPLRGDFGATGLIHKADATPHATLHALRLLRMMCLDNTGKSSATHGLTLWRGVPGVASLCTTLSDGVLRILLARQAWRTDDEITVTIRLPQSHRGRIVTRYVVNDRRSNQYEAGAAHTSLETVPQSAVASDGTLRFTLRGREVTLLELARR